MYGESNMSSIRTATVLVILAVIITGISMANKPNVEDGINITVSPSTLMLSRDIACVTVHTNIPIGSVDRSSLLLYGIEDTEPIAPYYTKSDSLGHLVAKFDGDLARTIVEPGQVMLTLTGLTVEDEIFSASDIIMVKK